MKTCSECKYLVHVPKNPNERGLMEEKEKIPACCFHLEISFEKDMSRCDLYTEYEKKKK